jgi:hypothetical protein
MTIKLAMVAMMYGLVVLAPRLFRAARTKPVPRG